MAGAADLGRGSRQAVAVATAGRLGTSWAARLLQQPPVRIAALCALVGGAAHLAAWGCETPWGRAPIGGGLLAAVGWGWVVWAWAELRRAGNPIAATAAPRVLVDHGPFALGRHPMYLGMVALLSGLALAAGSPALGGAAAVFAAVVANVHVPHEEATLAAAFGGWWRDYAATVRRWL